jgi:hypothetical protein
MLLMVALFAGGQVPTDRERIDQLLDYIGILMERIDQLEGELGDRR